MNDFFCVFLLCLSMRQTVLYIVVRRTVGEMTKSWSLMSIQCHYFCVSCYNHFVSLINFFLKILHFHNENLFPLLFLDLVNLHQNLCCLGVIRQKEIMLKLHQSFSEYQSSRSSELRPVDVQSFWFFLLSCFAQIQNFLGALLPWMRLIFQHFVSDQCLYLIK